MPIPRPAHRPGSKERLHLPVGQNRHNVPGQDRNSARLLEATQAIAAAMPYASTMCDVR